MRSDAEIQRDYYERTAQQYDKMHVREDDEHFVALRYVSGFLNLHNLKSVLDVGCGTGRGLKYLMSKNPHIKLHGVEPVPSLVRQAVEENSIPPEMITVGDGAAMPFLDQSFDATCEFGVLHHVGEPERVIREMMRVSRSAIFLSDENRFAHGSALSRWGKLTLRKVGLFRHMYMLKTLGRGYRFSEGDGLAYSYSVYDAFEALSAWADRVILIPTDQVQATSGWFHPLMSSFHVLLCAIKEK